MLAYPLSEKSVRRMVGDVAARRAQRVVADPVPKSAS
jgi:hypothetical protein